MVEVVMDAAVVDEADADLVDLEALVALVDAEASVDLVDVEALAPVTDLLTSAQALTTGITTAAVDAGAHGVAAVPSVSEETLSTPLP